MYIEHHGDNMSKNGSFFSAILIFPKKRLSELIEPWVLFETSSPYCGRL